MAREVRREPWRPARSDWAALAFCLVSLPAWMTLAQEVLKGDQPFLPLLCSNYGDYWPDGLIAAAPSALVAWWVTNQVIVWVRRSLRPLGPVAGGRHGRPRGRDPR